MGGSNRYAFHAFTVPGPAPLVRAEFARQERTLRRVARWVAREHSGVDREWALTHGRSGVEWLDRHLHILCEEAPRPSVQLLLSGAGSFLGACIRARIGGDWEWNQQFKGWCLRRGDYAAFTHAKVLKRYMNGPGDSLVTLYDAGLLEARRSA